MDVSPSIKAAQIVRCIGASLSLVASCTIIFMIKTEPKTGLQSPYSRIIFGLSVSDVLFSLGVLISPFASPKDTVDGIFSMGNTRSCDAIGFLTTIGVANVPCYTVFLTYYFLKRVKYKKTPSAFARCEEKVIHCFIWILSFVLSLSATIFSNINATHYGSICFIVPSPIGCENDGDYSDCIRGKTADLFAKFYGVAGLLSFVLLIAILAMFTWHVYSIESSLEPITTKMKVTEEENSRDGEEKQYNYIRKDVSLDEERENNVQENAPEGEKNAEPNETNSIDIPESGENSKERLYASHLHLSKQAAPEGEKNAEPNETNSIDIPESGENSKERLYTSHLHLSKQAFNQSMLYILAFFFVFLPSIVTVFMRSLRICPSCSDSNFMFIWMSIFYPIGGVVNILIYTRPKVFKLQQDLPQASWFVCFVIVIFSGGEVPSTADLGIQDYECDKESFDENEIREVHNDQNLLDVNIDRVPKFLQSLSGLSNSLDDIDKAFENRLFYESDPNV